MQADRHRRFQQHEDEEIVAAVVELFAIDRELNRTYATINGRPMFTLPLSDEEKWARWADPATRREIISQVTEREGPEAVPKYVRHMASLDKKLHKKNGTAPHSPAPPPVAPGPRY